MDDKKQYSSLTIDRAAFLLLRVKKAFKKKKLQRKEREKNALLASGRIDQKTSTAGIIELSPRKKPPLLRSRTLPAIIVPGVNILKVQLGSEAFGSTSNTNRLRIYTTTVGSHDCRRKSAVSRLCSSAGVSTTERHKDGGLLLRVPSPHVVAAHAYKINTKTIDGAGSDVDNLQKFNNKLLNVNETIDDMNVLRRSSWERKNYCNGTLPRSSSIDSMIQLVWHDVSPSSLSINQKSTCSSFQNQSTFNNRSARNSFASISPSLGRRAKGQRGLNELSSVLYDNHNAMEITNSLPPISINNHQQKIKKETKQQRMERLAKINIHLHALFAAIEHGHLEKARTILESTDIDVNSTNNDGLTPLDVAVLSNNRPLVKMLIGFGAHESTHFSTPDQLNNHLKHLLNEAELRLEELGGSSSIDSNYGGARGSFSNVIGSTSGHLHHHQYTISTSSSTMMIGGCASGGDTDKQQIIWERRTKLLRRLVLGFTQLHLPDPPGLVAVDVTSASRVNLRLNEPITTNDSAIITKFKIQWSNRADFATIVGERVIDDWSILDSCTIGLVEGRRYFFRAASGNLKGYGGYLTSTPTSIVASTWRQVDNKPVRFDNNRTRRQLESLADEIRQIRPDIDMDDQTTTHRRTQRKKTTTIKQLFTAASKFQKNLKRGIYLACILYHEDKILMTNEDFLPVIEIDDNYPNCIYSDIYWLMKVSCTWDDIKMLRNEMEKITSSTIHFRTKLLSAIIQMQSSLGSQDLGRLYFKPLRDINGTVVLSVVNYMKNPKMISVLNSKWLPMNKIYKKMMVLNEDSNISDILIGSIQEQIGYHQVSGLKLTKGLYLCYVKMQSSVDMIQVVVPTKSPNMLPHCKIRDNSHVTKEEWNYLKHQHLPDVTDNPTEQQRTFLELVTSASKRLFNYMDINDDDDAILQHRLYDHEVFELTESVAFIVICPSSDQSCSVPGQKEILLQRADLLCLPLQVFEMINLDTYQPQIVRKYAQLSCLLELDSAAANHTHRQAFSNSELIAAKERLNQLQSLQTRLGNLWKNARWLMDVITFARDRTQMGVSMRLIVDRGDIGTTPCRLLQIPRKCTPGRGSWPGPATLPAPPPLHSEFSKSEQQLSRSIEAQPPDELLRPDSIGHRQRSATSSPTSRRRDGSTASVTTTISGSLRSLSSEVDEGGNTPRRTRMSVSKSMTNVKEETAVHLTDVSGPIDHALSRSLSNLKHLKPPDTVFKIPETSRHSNAQSGILQVYAAYETGLANGTSLKLHVTSRTTAREIVDLVIKQLNMAVVLKGKSGPIYSMDKLKNFCLVAVIGARERCLRDDFKPLQLQNPWKKGRLYVRQKHDVLAALEHSSKHNAII